MPGNARRAYQHLSIFISGTSAKTLLSGMRVLLLAKGAFADFIGKFCLIA
jgi:hypothetical protein